MDKKEQAYETLDFLEKALVQSIGYIDELNGRLEEAVNHLAVDIDESIMDELKELYMQLPVWSKLEDIAKRVYNLKEDLRAVKSE